MKPLITLPAHYEPEKGIILDSPYTLYPNDKLLITNLRSEAETSERDEWLEASLYNLNRAYGEDEPEYPLSLIKEFNSEYNFQNNCTNFNK